MCAIKCTWSTFGFSMGQAVPESSATAFALASSRVPKTERLLLTALARMLNDVPWSIFWYLNT